MGANEKLLALGNLNLVGSGAGEATPDGTGPAERDPVLDWPGLFELMGLEIADFTAVEPRLRPPHFADRRTAWQGVYPEDPETSLRIEVAHLDGRLVSLRGFASYDPVPSPPGGSTSQDTGSGGSTSQDTGNGASASQDTGNGGSTSQDTGNGASEDPGPSVSLATIVTILVLVTIVASILTAIFGAVWVARRNVASGRGDARGARRVGTLIAAAIGIEWLLGEHTFSFSDINAFLEMLIFVGAFGGLAWALYLAVEPFMRRNAPRALIGWTRLVDGRLSDPLVGRDLLLGCAAGAVSRLLAVIPMVLAEPGETAVNYVGLPFPSLGRMLGGLVGSTAQSIVVGLALLFLFGLTFVALRRRWWAAYALWVGFAAAMAFLPGLTVNNVMPAATRSTSIFWILGSALVLFVLFRLGILAYVAAAATSWLLASSLPTLDFTAWYAQTSIAALVILAGLAAYAFHRCVVWRGRLAEALAGG